MIGKAGIGARAASRLETFQSFSVVKGYAIVGAAAVEVSVVKSYTVTATARIFIPVVKSYTIVEEQ